MHHAFMLECAINSFFARQSFSEGGTFNFHGQISITTLIILMFMKYFVSEFFFQKIFGIHFKKHPRKIFSIISSRTGNYRHDRISPIKNSNSFFFHLEFSQLLYCSLSFYLISPKIRSFHSIFYFLYLFVYFSRIHCFLLNFYILKILLDFFFCLAILTLQSAERLREIRRKADFDFLAIKTEIEIRLSAD